MGVIYTDKDAKFAKEHEITKTPWEVWQLILSSGPGSPRTQASAQPVSDSLV